MTAKTTPLQPVPPTQQRRPPKYFAFTRRDMLPYVPSSALRVLDVGCGIGVFGEHLKRRPGCRVDGVEPDPEVAHEARTRLDHVWTGPFDQTLALPENAYDCVVFNDVLEHMIDPHAALFLTRALLRSRGVVVASIPNIRHFPTLWKLVVQGRWDYAEAGTLDRTHLRFFTRATIQDLFDHSGYRILTLAGINRFQVNDPGEERLWRYLKMLQLLSLEALREMSYLQFAVVAGLSPDVTT